MYVLYSLINIAVTEIDFQTYVRQAQLFMDGERTYTKIDPPGGSGPCVYPAGHLYVYSLFNLLSAQGTDLFYTQVVFGALYLCTILAVSQIYRAAKAPPILILSLALSKRLHSIFVLRLFNDPISMLFMYMCMYLLCHRRWKAACVSYS